MKFIGLMGVKGNNVMVTPSGRKLFALPFGLSSVVQRIQHKIAQRTWR